MSESDFDRAFKKQKDKCRYYNMRAERRIFKEMLEEIIIPETMLLEKRISLLKPLLEYVNSITPSRLFRYRECSERQFDAFLNDRIYAVNAQLFNDPYDCLIRYDKKYLYDSINKGASKDAMKQMRDSLKRGEQLPEYWASICGEKNAQAIEEFICNVTDDVLDKLCSDFAKNNKEFWGNIEYIFKQAEDYLRKNTFIACFSETVKSVTMWSHYADSHKGFVLEYNLKGLNCRCDTCNEKDTCNDRLIYNLYPVIYDNKRYDATSFVEHYLGLSLGLNAQIPDRMYYTKAALYKSPQWKYEKEWRLFLYKNNSVGLSNLSIQIKPIAIYYGNDISVINKKILREIAKEKKLKEYQMYIDIQSNNYSMKYKRI